MDSMSYLFMGIAGLLIIVFVILSLRTGTKKYRVTLANDEVLELTKKWSDSWNDSKEMKIYRKDNKRIVISTHWIIKSEEL